RRCDACAALGAAPELAPEVSAGQGVRHGLHPAAQRPVDQLAVQPVPRRFALRPPPGHGVGPIVQRRVRQREVERPRRILRTRRLWCFGARRRRRGFRPDTGLARAWTLRARGNLRSGAIPLRGTLRRQARLWLDPYDLYRAAAVGRRPWGDWRDEPRQQRDVDRERARNGDYVVLSYT